MTLFDWIVILFLILANALYVAAEFAAVSVRDSRIRQLAHGGSALARRLLPILQDTHKLDRYIAACQIGITLSSLVLGAYGQATIARDLAALLRDAAGMTQTASASTAAVAVLILLTTLQVVFGELVPKSLALQFPTTLALYTYWPMRWSLTLYAVFIAVLNGSGLLLLRLFGMHGHDGGHRHIHSPEELEMLIAESREGGLLKPKEQERLQHALRLGRRTARQLMVPRRLVKMVDAAAPVRRVIEIAIESPYTRLPVYRESRDNVIGLLHTKDLAARYAENGDALNGGIKSLKEVLRPITSVPSGVSADQLLKSLREQRSRLALVLDEFGGVEGIVTLEDVLNELLGEIADEFKGGQPAPERLPDGRVRLPGLLRLDEAEEWTKVLWDDDKADTIAGLVLAELEHLPVEGECVTVDGVTFEVERMDGQAIASLLVTPKTSDKDVTADADGTEFREASR